MRFDRDAIALLIEEATGAVGALEERIGDGRLVVTKHDLTGILGCELQHVHREPFAWSIRTATGTVVHRAVQLLVNWSGDAAPSVLVDEAVDRLRAEDSSLAEWLAACTEADLADLRGAALDAVNRFAESFPPLGPRAVPVVEARLAWRADARLQFRGRVDLMLGRASGDESRKVLVDLKTGASALAHAQDLRFYALLETLSRGVPPRAVASFYLDAAEAVVERVTMPALWSALERVLQATEALVEIHFQRREPVTRPGWQCRWCPISHDCPEGQEWLTADRQRTSS